MSADPDIGLIFPERRSLLDRTGGASVSSAGSSRRKQLPGVRHRQRLPSPPTKPESRCRARSAASFPSVTFDEAAPALSGNDQSWLQEPGVELSGWGTNRFPGKDTLPL